ncbi:echinoderm microtubule-associated protein-like 2 isoform X2 [Stegostoma tigrinum]|uniref:echinoderm microtubule-associated protein-like 2 isoform X2 n=1 Tax=Stegostoma tigrinum TaxID=3053191 RepID=UPI00202B8D7D|nr:echinoderm microtubule-associated protein-like 2 isoform X2 [Stegostoma tigrinum]
MTDDSVSATSSMDVDDRISYLEQRMQLQDDEIQVLKAALADVVRRLAHAEEQHTLLNKRAPSRARLFTQALPSRPTLTNGTATPPKRSNAIPQSPSSPRKETSSTRSKHKDSIFSAEDGYVKMFLRGRPVTLYMPQALTGTYKLQTTTELPAHKLKMEWVYGYRGRDCRSNLYLLPTGEIVYFIASAVVLYNVEEQLQRHYLGHNDDVKCLAVHPDRVTMATGQVAGTTKDGKHLPPHVRVWDSVSLNTLHVIGSGVFDRGISCVSFSKSNGGVHLCAVDDSNEHILSVWDWQKEQKVADVKCSNESVLAVSFHPTEAQLLITCGKSHICFWTMEGNTLSKKHGIFEKQEKPKYLLCLAFSENGDVITGDSSGNLIVWGKGTNRISSAVQGAHEGGIFSLCVLNDGTLVSGGGKDRKVILWDRQYHKVQETEIPEAFGPVRTIAEGKGDGLFVGTTRNCILQGTLSGGYCPIVQGHMDELWGLAAHPGEDRFVTCGQDKLIHFWDSTSHQPVWSKALDDPAQSVGFHPSGSVVAVGLQTARWMVFDVETKDPITVHTDGNEKLSVMSYSPDGNYLAIGSHDNYVYIYTVAENGRKYNRVGRCSGHSSFITHLDWSTDSRYIVTNSGDYEVLFWTPNCKQVTSVDVVRDLEWATSTCVLSFQVFGVWPEGADGTDINAICRSSDDQLLVTADDFGKVNLFPYPCSHPRAPSHKYSGHSSHVTNVAFLHDNTHLISTGGKDMSVIQWSVA